MANNFNNPNAWWNTPNYATALDRTSANPLFQIPQNYPQTQNLPTNINLDWLNNFQNTQPSSQNQGGFLNLQPYYSQVNYPRTDIDFLNLNSDGVIYSRNEDGTLGRVAGVSKTVENAPEIAATEAGQTEKQQLQTTAPVQQTPPAPTQPTSSLADAIKKYQSGRDALNGNQNPTQLLNLKDATTSILPVIPDRNQYNNNSLLKLQNIEPENWTPQQWGWMGDIYSAKMAYEADTANINWYNQQLAKTDLSDADRKKYTDARDGLIKQRENVMNEAAMIRRTALANGFDIDAMGMSALGDNLGASTQAMNYFQERNRKSLLDLPTPKQFNNQRRKELDEQGYGAFHSLMLADKETSDYIDDASNRLLYAMQMDGTTNGVINNNGIGYLKQLSKIDPTSANIFMQQYASPAQGLQLQTQTLNNILNNDSAMSRLLANIAAQKEHQANDIAARFGLLTQSQDFQSEQNDKNRDLKKYQLDLNYNYQNAKLNLDTAEALAKDARERLKIWQDSPEGKMAGAKYFAGIFFPNDPEKQKQYAASYLNPRHTTDKEQTDTENEIQNRLNAIKKDFVNGNKEGIREKLDSLKADFVNPEMNYMKKLTPESYDENGLILELYDNYLNNNLSMWDVYDQTFRLVEGRNPNTNENGDPEWLLRMPQKEREEFLNACAKERGYRKSTPSTNRTITNREVYNQMNPYSLLPYMNNNLVSW